MQLVTLPIAHWLPIQSIQRLIHLAKYMGTDYVNDPLCIKDWTESIKDAGGHKSTSFHTYAQRMGDSWFVQRWAWNSLFEHHWIVPNEKKAAIR